MSETRVFKASTEKEYEVPSKCCFFCKHCTDIWLDYTHGPYMIACEKDQHYDGEQLLEMKEDYRDFPDMPCFEEEE